MKSTLLYNIGSLIGTEESGSQRGLLAGKEMDVLSKTDYAWLLCEEGKIHSFGSMETAPEGGSGTEKIDCSGRLVLPAWCDSHTHLVFPATREGEFEDRIRGMSYAEIAARGGGILTTARKMAEAGEEALFEDALRRLHQVVAQGTGAIEIKSGYGLNTEAELKMLRVIRRLKEEGPIPVRASFLAAHAYPPPYRENHEGYLKLIEQEMLPRVAGEGLADYIDVFCEQGFFSVSETARLLEAGAKWGLKPKIHANQLHHSGGVEVGVAHGAVSVDHLECVGEREIEALKGSNTMPTLLPAAAFFLGMHYQPARAIIDAGLPVCLATDYNPGSCPGGNIPLLMTIACTQLKMTPAEAFHAVTINGAAALEWAGELGSIAAGKKANLAITHPMQNLAQLPYDFGNNPVWKMIL